MTEFYSLEGRPAKLEAFFSAPFQIAKKWITNDDELLIIRISQSVIGIFIALLSLPFKGFSLAINFVFREKIDPETYEKEFQTWNKIFFHYHDRRDLGPDFLLKGEKQLINELIRARVKASDCKYQQILLNFYSDNDSVNMFNADGRHPLFYKYYMKGKCLFIGCSYDRKVLSLLWHKFDSSQMVMNGDFKKYILELHDSSTMLQIHQRKVDCLWCEADKLPQQIIPFLT
jgi:hypothetical protein